MYSEEDKPVPPKSLIPKAKEGIRKDSSISLNLTSKPLSFKD